MPLLALWATKPIGWPMLLSALGLFLFGFWEAAKPCNFGGTIGAALGWVLLIGCCVVRAATRQVVAVWYGRPHAERRRGWMKAVLVVTVLICWLAVPRDWPEVVGFQISWRALDQFVQRAIADPSQAAGDRWVGLYSISLDAVVSNGVWIFTNWGYDGSRCGFFYARTGWPQDHEDAVTGGYIHYRLLEGQWYDYYEHRWPPRPLGTPPQNHPCIEGQ